MQINKKDFFNIPNLLSLYRLILGFVFPLLWIKKISSQTLLFLIGSAVLSDTLDGNIARLFNQKTELGKILDPLADKVFINMLFILLYLDKKISLGLVLLIIFRDLSILCGGILLLIKHQNLLILNPTFLGKASTVAQLLFLFFQFINLFIKPLNTILIFTMIQIIIFLTLASGLHYAFLFLKSYKTSPIK